jgi:hypothetical protein
LPGGCCSGRRTVSPALSWIGCGVRWTSVAYKLLVGIALYAVWVLALAVVAAVSFNAWAGLGALLVVPAVGMTGLVIRERWRGAGGDVRRFILLRSRRELVDTLRATQRDLGGRLDSLYQAFAARGAA